MAMFTGIARKEKKEIEQKCQGTWFLLFDYPSDTGAVYDIPRWSGSEPDLEYAGI